METKVVVFNLKASQMSYLALSASFECLCYRYTAIRNMFTLTLWGSTLDVRIYCTKTARSRLLLSRTSPGSVNKYNVILCYNYAPPPPRSLMSTTVAILIFIVACMTSFLLNMI